MGGQNSGRQVIDAESLFRDVQRRLMHEERRPHIRTASDIMGPGLAPNAVELTDWNQDEATFNGLWFSQPGASNSPGDDDYWAGYTIGNVDGYGIQVVTKLREQDGELPTDWEPDQYVRRFYTLVAGVHRSYSTWRKTFPASEDIIGGTA